MTVVWSEATRAAGRIGVAAAVLSCAPVGAFAAGGDVAIGLGLAATKDLPDASNDHTVFDVGPALQIPVRIGLSSHANLRINLRADFATGADQVTWDAGIIDSQSYRFVDDDHPAFLIAGAASLGAEVVLPVEGGLRPYFGAGLGLAYVRTHHDLGGRARELFLDEEGFEPWTQQVAPMSDFNLGFLTGGSFQLWVELGYSTSFLPEAALVNADEELAGTRSAYVWNALRGGLGFSVVL